MQLSQIKQQNLKGLLEPVAEFLRKHCHSHITLIVTNNAYEILEGQAGGDLGPINKKSTTITNDSNRISGKTERDAQDGSN